MNSIRTYIGRYHKLVRLAVLMQLVAVFLPVEQVWCSDSGSDSFRLEPAINGDCISWTSSDCCGPADNSIPAEQQAISNPAAEVAATEHDHCCSCTDDLAHQPQQALRTDTQNTSRNLDAGGCLYQTGTHSTIAHYTPAAKDRAAADLARPPDLVLILANSSVLLI